MPRPSRHLELLSAVALAAALRCSQFSLVRRRDLPRPLKVGSKRYWFRNEVASLLPAPRRYSDTIGPEELATLLSISPNQLYRMVRAGLVPPPTRFRATGRRRTRGNPWRSRWSRRNVETFLRALPR